MRTNVPRAMRLLRHRKRWRQQELGARAGMSRDAVSRAETGQLGGLTVRALDRLVEALGATLVIEMRWHGAELDRLGDRAHASLQEAVSQRRAAAGWITRAEVTFDHYGDRGSCDIVAFHPATRTLLVVEIKSGVGNVQETLHRLDTKARLARVLAEQLGWPVPTATARALVLVESRSSRSVIAAHPTLFEPFSMRGRSALGWIRAPAGDTAALLWFEKSPDSGHGRAIGAQRVRQRRGAG